MALTVSGQKPAVLDPVHLVSPQGDYDPLPAIEATLAEPLRQPLTAGVPATIIDAQGRDVADEITEMLLACMTGTIDPDAEEVAKDLLGQSLVHYDRSNPLPVHEMFAVQAGTRNKMPAPRAGVLYNARDDVIPAAKALLGSTSDDSELLAALSYAYHPNTLGFWFSTESAFDDFTAWLDQQVQQMSAALPAKTNRLMGEFRKTKLDGLTESFRLRQDSTDNNDEFSLARLLVNLLMGYVSRQRQAATGTTDVGVLPFSVDQLFCPTSIVLVNVEAHARASSQKVEREWRIINQSLSNPIRMVSNKQLTQLTAAERYRQKVAATAASTKAGLGQPGSRSAKVVFRKKEPSKVELLADVSRTLTRMGQVNKSQNVFREAKSSYLKPNRRDPMDMNKPGHILTTKYMPDIHAFIDTSGSISEDNYQDAVTLLIGVAKKLDVNLYFNSFSHILSQETLLRIKGRSLDQIWASFSAAPKVSGWTDYKQIWDYINASPVRKRRMSLVVTDFEWVAPNTREDHPKNLFYAPCSGMDWDRIKQYADGFARSMQHIDPGVSRHMLGVYQ